MKAYHPTTINMHDNHCPYAVQLWKERVPYDRSIFHTGVVAHAILEEIATRNAEEPTQNPKEKLVVINNCVSSAINEKKHVVQWQSLQNY